MTISKADLTIDFSKFAAGLNTKDPQTSIGDQQAYTGSKNAKFKKDGIAPWPGFRGLKSTRQCSTPSKGFFEYPRVAGGGSLVLCSGGYFYNVDKSTGDVEILGTYTGSEKFYAASFYDKLFLTNESGNYVLSGTNVTSVGIAPPPDTVTAGAYAGSSTPLPEGTYSIYVAYVQIFAGANVLYSTGTYLGDVTVSDVNNYIIINNFANSSDPRVNNKVVFMAAPGDDEIVFQYYQTGNNTDTTITIENLSQKNSSILYRIVSEPSYQPPQMVGIYSHDDRLFGWNGNTLYASMQAVTVFDIERWPGISYDFPYQIIGLFSIGEDLFISTVKGTIKLPGADMAAQYSHLTKRFWFVYPDTIDHVDENSEENPSPVIGMTNDGIRIFDGIRFSRDLAVNIKDRITAAYKSNNENFIPFGIVHRTTDRAEYRLSYRDLSVNSSYNNQQLKLNLDTLNYSSLENFNASWEIGDIGFQNACIDETGTLYMAQSGDDFTNVIKESEFVSYDVNVWGLSGEITSNTAKDVVVVSKMVLPSIKGRVLINQLRYLSYTRSAGTIEILIGDDKSKNQTFDIEKVGTDGIRWGSFRWGVDSWTSTDPIVVVENVAENIKGVVLYMVIKISSNYINDFITEIKLIGSKEEGNYR